MTKGPLSKAFYTAKSGSIGRIVFFFVALSGREEERVWNVEELRDVVS